VEHQHHNGPEVDLGLLPLPSILYSFDLCLEGSPIDAREELPSTHPDTMATRKEAREENILFTSWRAMVKEDTNAVLSELGRRCQAISWGVCPDVAGACQPLEVSVGVSDLWS